MMMFKKQILKKLNKKLEVNKMKNSLSLKNSFDLLKDFNNYFFSPYYSCDDLCECNTGIKENFKEDESAYYDEFLIPKLDKNNLKVGIENHKVKVEYHVKSTEENTKYHFKQFSEQDFVRYIEIPENVEESSISAKTNNGVLTIVFPKTEKEISSERVIEID